MPIHIFIGFFIFIQLITNNHDNSISELMDHENTYIDTSCDNRSYYDKSGSSYIVSKDETIILSNDDSLPKKSLFSSLTDEEKRFLRREKARSDITYTEEAIKMYYKQEQEISELDAESKDFEKKKDEIIKKCTKIFDDKFF